jgi:hypothetical protein
VAIGALVVDDDVIFKCGEEKRGENQSPLRSTKQRSDQWQEERKRMRRSAEQ